MAGIFRFALFSFLLAASVEGDQTRDPPALPEEAPPHEAGGWQILREQVPSQQTGVRSCPIPFLTQEKANPKQVADPVCPENDGDIFQGANGSWYRFQCCAHLPTGTTPKMVVNTIVPTFRECEALCALDTACESFVYNAIKGNVDPQGLCKGYDAGGFTTTKCGDNSHDYSHLLPDPPTHPVFIRNRKRCATECPDADGQILTARNGEIFHVDCGRRHGTDFFYRDTQASLSDCLAACAAMTSCRNADYQIMTKTCFYSTNEGPPLISDAAFDSVRSLGFPGQCVPEPDCVTCKCVNPGPSPTGTGTPTGTSCLPTGTTSSDCPDQSTLTSTETSTKTSTETSTETFTKTSTETVTPPTTTTTSTTTLTATKTSTVTYTATPTPSLFMNVGPYGPDSCPAPVAVSSSIPAGFCINLAQELQDP